MSGQQSNAWQTANRGRHNASASRTPQNRSGTASPAQSTPPTQTPKSSDPSARPAPAAQPPASNVWSQRGSNTSTSTTTAASNGSASNTPSGFANDAHVSANGFNASEVRAFLSREAAPPAPYKPDEQAGTTRGSGAAWSSKAGHMANNQPFFVQLAKQFAAFEGGG